MRRHGVTAGECFAKSLAKLAERNQIDRGLLETIFDEAEELSLNGQTPTPATTAIRAFWGEIGGAE